MKPTGKGRRGVLIVAEAPGKEEDQRGIQLIGDAGKRLRRTLTKIGVDLDKDCWKTNAVICRPPNNATPDSTKIEACRYNLLSTIDKFKPHCIVLLGGSATESLIGHVWGTDHAGSISTWAGWRIPCQEPNAWVCPTYHPSYLLRCNDQALDLHFEHDLAAAFGLTGVPWPSPQPDPRASIQVVMDPHKAARIIKGMVAKGGLTSFDYETTTLKPDGPHANIVSCSICWRGERTIAYPMHGEAVAATKEYLSSDCKKIASNMKFEERWTRAIFKMPVKNWVFDTMLAAHVLDNRMGISGLKIQAFLRLGVKKYNNQIEEYLEAPTGNSKNRIKEADLNELLLYNGLDSLSEYQLAGIQARELGVDL
jgi:DNA polymerase